MSVATDRGTMESIHRTKRDRRTVSRWACGLGMVMVPAVVSACSTPDATTPATVRLGSAAAKNCQKTFIPAYFGPGAEWTQAVKSQPTPNVMILDVSGLGAGTAPQDKFRVAVRHARAAGVTVLGYSATQYAQRSPQAVEADVENYKAWYGVTGIFLDEVSSSTKQLPYYRRLDTFIHTTTAGAIVWLNPGTYPSSRYMSVGNVLMVYEGTYANYVGQTVPAWVHRFAASRFAHTIYATPASSLDTAIELARTRNAEYVYVTQGSGSDPYSALPSYWSTEDAAVADECVGGARSAAKAISHHASSHRAGSQSA